MYSWKMVKTDTKHIAKFYRIERKQGSTSPLARSPEACKKQAGLVNILHSVVRGRVESCGNSLRHIGITLCSCYHFCWKLLENKTTAEAWCISRSLSHIHRERFTALTWLRNHTTSGFYYHVTKLRKISGVLQLRCHLRSSLSSKLGFRVTKKASKSNLKVTVEPRFNEVAKDWGKWFVIWRFFSIH